MNKQTIVLFVIALLPQVVKADCAYSPPPSIQEMTYMNQAELVKLHCTAQIFYEMDAKMGDTWFKACMKMREAYGYGAETPDAEIDGCNYYVEQKQNMNDCENVINNTRRVLRKDYGVEEVQCGD